MSFTAPKPLQNTVAVTSDRQGSIASYGYQTRELLSFIRTLVDGVIAAYSDADSASAISVTASPMTYTAQSRQSVHIAGGTVTGMSFVRGSTALSLATTSGQMIQLNPGDQLVITYSSAPTLTAVPR